MKHALKTFSIAAMMATSAFAADDVKLPDTLTWTSFDVGGTGYNQSIAVGKALQDAYGTSLRVIAVSNDQARIAPVRDGRVPFSLAGSDVFFAFEGVQAYASAEWGPQNLRALNLAGADNCVSLGVAADSGIETPADVKGKRVGWVVSSGSLQANVRAFLAFAGLTTDDVELVELPGYAQAWTAMINDQIDAMTGVTTSGVVEQAAASARGLKWLSFPHEDQEGWDRLREVNPHFSKRVGTLGAGFTGPVECAGVPYPDLITYNADEDLVYNLTKALDAQVDVYSKADAGTVGYAADKQMFDWVVPYDAGAIRYYKEAGVWSDALQTHNDALIERAGVLAEAWKQMDGKSGDGFAEEWMDVRAAALEAAGLPVYFR
ncbi:TAXI family TRAP transporter solute-binding subunit [Mariluticola halotolerans]|uniref:TAXI family TRAP transporter solute-binding subunit n=1 Tax=Mariluticola halotolerans TaxID=2909283 RepID=UPI0026E45EC1|nr:TAXI family TRAP transporter solute-binding subunit [Mariluticola halotolerans]UJQ94710.1 TAXI family TRAP transporter solute-binding subunit [Mariluticola halotolerans]